MKNIISLLVVILLGLSSIAFASVKPDSLKVTTTGFAIASYCSQSGSYEMEHARMMLVTSYGPTSMKVEFDAVAQNILVRALICYQMPYGFSFTAGQQPLDVIAFVPSPDNYPTALTPLAYLIPNFFDIGGYLKWKNPLLNVGVGLFNGTGPNKNDDNQAKDLSIRLELTPKNVIFGFTYQDGQQTNGERKAYLVNGQWKPISLFEFNGAYLKRTDLRQEGWFVNNLVNLSTKVQLVSQYLRGNRGEELTLGFNLFPNQLNKIQFSWVFGKQIKPGLWLKLQQSF